MAAHFLTCHPNLNQMSCALVHASALPLIGVVPGCLAALVSLVRLVVASVFCLVSGVLLSALMAVVPPNDCRDFSALQELQYKAGQEAHISALFLVRSLLSIVSAGFCGFAFEQLSQKNYAIALGRAHIAAPYHGYNTKPVWFS